MVTSRGYATCGHAALARLAIAAGLIALAQSAAQAADPTGTWLVADRSAQIKIEACGSNGYYGIIDWEKEPGVDANNRDPSRRGTPMLGLAILIDMKPSRPAEWQGNVYNPKDGGFYFARLSMPQDNALRLEGCILGGLLCDGETWTRVPQATAGTARSRGRGRSACPAPSRNPAS